MSRRRPPRTEDSTEPQPRLSNQPMPSMEDARPFADDVLSVAEVHGISRLRDLRFLQQLYDHFIESAQTDWDFGGYILTFLRTSGEVSRSVPVDRAVGELVAGRL